MIMQSHSNNPTRRLAAFTLTEMLVVVGIGILLVTFTLPAIRNMGTSARHSQARNAITSAMTQARAQAISTQNYAGIRFQFDAAGWRTGTQYLVMIEKAEPYGTNTYITDEYTAVDNAKPLSLPRGIVVLSDELISLGSDDICNDYLDDDPTNDVDNDSPSDSTKKNDARFCMDGAATFCIIFSPDGQIIQRDESYVISRNNITDRIFGTDAETKTSPPDALLSRDRYRPIGYNGEPWITGNTDWCRGSPTATGFIIADVEYLANIPDDTRWRDITNDIDYLKGLCETSQAHVRINSYTGTVIQEDWQ